MTADYLLHAIGQIDDELVMEALTPPSRRPSYLVRWGALAATVAVCVGLTALSHSSRKNTSLEYGFSMSDSILLSLSASQNVADVAPENSASGQTDSSFDFYNPTINFSGKTYHVVCRVRELPEGCTKFGTLSADDIDANTRDTALAKDWLSVTNSAWEGYTVWIDADGTLFIALPAGNYALVAPADPS